MKFILLILFFLSPFAFANTDQQIDIELSQLEKTMKTSPDEGGVLFSALHDKSSILNNDQLARLWMIDAQRQIMIGNFETALIRLDDVQKVATDRILLTQSYMYKVTSYIGLKNYTSAFIELRKNLERVETYQDLELKLESYLRILNVYLDMDAYKESKRISEKLLDLNKQQSPKSHCYGLVGLGYSNLNLRLYQEATSTFDEAYAYCQTHEFSLVGAMALKGLAEINLEMSEYSKAKEQLETALNVYQRFNFSYELSRTNALLAIVHYHIKEFETATHYAELVNALPNDSIYMLPKRKVSEILSMLANRQGRYKEAYQYQVLAHALDMQIINEKKVKENAYQMVKFDSAEKTRELNQLVQDHEMIAKQRSMLNNEKSSSFMFSTVLVGTVAFLSLMLSAAWMQRNQFRKQAQIDALTGLYNRGAGIEKAENEFIQVQAQQGSISVIVIDLDWFKKINDSYGHATGDWALKKVADTITEHKRASDIVCRLGGEEFAIFMPFTDIDFAYECAQSLCTAFANINTRYSGHQFTITGSFGVSDLTNDDLSLDPILNRADNALYKAKSEGRNRVVKS
ncbi:hypothetical protein BCU84_04920 [Shewanella sp. 10N.286.51.B7]|uniref:tetratricopeptide repeat-containing diguanylate cyclase n=1 Tax=Shewanella sp. 10N.286.51.B7 TaxID=1880836 RepID=UPI000C8399CD|nr:GGDEF domain-containing protein [Shewanella sp. 10N.286.51.B7]PMG79650.1 hypothetical protein BCU84_04920 [Shewanella sp. 10N.286.51.B7]